MGKTAETAVVCRRPGMEPDILARYWERLDTVTFARAVASGQRAAKERELLFIAHEPLRKLIEQDENSMVALRVFSELRKEDRRLFWGHEFRPTTWPQFFWASVRS